MEAIIGATYLALGMEAANGLVLDILGTRLATAQRDGADHKSRLQELSVHLLGAPPRYEVVSDGPDHARRFSVTVTVNGTAFGKGEGRSKKQAEQGAARAAIEALIGAEADIPRENNG